MHNRDVIFYTYASRNQLMLSYFHVAIHYVQLAELNTLNLNMGFIRENSKVNALCFDFQCI